MTAPLDWSKPLELIDGRPVVRASRAFGRTDLYKVWLLDGTKGLATVAELRNVSPRPPRWEWWVMAASLVVSIGIMLATGAMR